MILNNDLTMFSFTTKLCSEKNAHDAIMSALAQRLVMR